jgi:hypothetical protein
MPVQDYFSLEALYTVLSHTVYHYSPSSLHFTVLPYTSLPLLVFKTKHYIKHPIPFDLRLVSSISQDDADQEPLQHHPHWKAWAVETPGSQE